MECIYDYGTCANTNCPMHGLSCPVPDVEGICKYEEREEVAYTLTPKGCLSVALLNNGIKLDDVTFDAVWNDFAETMTRCGYIEEEE